MSTGSMMSAPHFHEVELVRFIDQEGSAEEQRRWDAHVEACESCWVRVDELRRDSQLVSRWLAAADFERPSGFGVAADLPTERTTQRGVSAGTIGRSPWRMGAQSPWLKAAIFVLFLAAPLAAFPGVREWVAHRVTGEQVAPPAAPSTAATPEAMAPSSLIRFVPAPGMFALDLDSVQAGGTLTVERAPEGDEALLHMTGSDPLPDPVISARSIQLGNTSATTASYALMLPREVVALSITIAGSMVHLDARALDRGTVIPLDRSPAEQ